MDNGLCFPVLPTGPHSAPSQLHPVNRMGVVPPHSTFPHSADPEADSEGCQDVLRLAGDRPALVFGLLLHWRELFISLELWFQRTTFLCSTWDFSYGLTSCLKLEEAAKTRVWKGGGAGAMARSAFVSTARLSLWDMAVGSSELTAAAAWLICRPSQWEGSRPSHEGREGTADCEGEDGTVRAATSRRSAGRSLPASQLFSPQRLEDVCVLRRL